MDKVVISYSRRDADTVEQKEQAQEKFLEILGEIVQGSIVDAGKAFVITKIEEMTA